MFPHITDFRPTILMPPKSTYTKNPKKRDALDKARRARLSCGQGHSAKPFSASADDEYVHTGSSLSDAESAEEAKGDTSPGTIIYIYVIHCMPLINIAHEHPPPQRSTRAGRYTPVETLRNRQPSSSSSQPTQCAVAAHAAFDQHQ
jgi:hypothetical protein